MTTPDWFPIESNYAGEEHLDTSYVQTYEEKAGVEDEKDIATLRELGLNDTHLLIDMGAGTGKFAVAVAPHCRKVIALDVSPAMIKVMGNKVSQHAINNVEYQQSGFLLYEHQGELADFVYTRHALHHLPDFWKAIALQRIANIMKPGGVLYLIDLVYSFEPNETEQVLEHWFSLAPESPDDGWTRAELEIHVREEHSTFNWLLELMLKQAGFKIEKVSHHPLKVHSSYICVKT